jgi:hypothetical protein
VRRRRDVRSVLGEDPEPEAPRLADARDHHARTCGRDEVRVGTRRRHPPLAHPNEAAARERTLDAMPTVTGTDEVSRTDDTAHRIHVPDDGLGCMLGFERNGPVHTSTLGDDARTTDVASTSAGKQTAWSTGEDV